MTRLIFLLFLFLNQVLLGQNLSKKDLLEDLTFLEEAVVNGHPVNYNPLNKLSIQSVLDSAKQIKTDSLSASDYTLWIEKGIYHIGCVHTSIKVNPLLTLERKPLFIPLTASIYKDKLLITSCSDSSKVGLMIDSVNGVNVETIIEKYKEYKASDGGSDAFSKEYFHYASSKIISNFLNNPNQFFISVSDNDFTLNAVDQIYLNDKKGEEINSLVSNNKNTFYILNDFAVLKVAKFSRNDKRYFNSVFNKLDQIKSENLILDLRQNTGGNRRAGVQLTRFLIDTSFSYSILKPKLKTNNYLNRKGKFYLALAKLKYNVGALFKVRRTNLGREFVFRYGPKKKHHYNGKIYVLTDGFTASSSTMVTSWLKQFNDAVFIGKQAGGGYNGNNGGSFPILTLPKSQIQIKFPAYRLIVDNHSDHNAGIIPDIPLSTNIEMSEILELIEKLMN